ncbi:hypothetical protein GCM10022221_73240 [Actinocorallia aurea]
MSGTTAAFTVVSGRPDHRELAALVAALLVRAAAAPAPRAEIRPSWAAPSYIPPGAWTALAPGHAFPGGAGA